MNRREFIVIMIALCVLFALVTCSCSNIIPKENFAPEEYPHLYWKTIDVEVEDISQSHWFAMVHRYEMTITVRSEEYNLEKTFSIYSQGMAPSGWDCKKGDIIQAELYTWKIDSTGEIVKREINRIL
jgi:hypothetical protein